MKGTPIFEASCNTYIEHDEDDENLGAWFLHRYGLSLAVWPVGRKPRPAGQCGAHHPVSIVRKTGAGADVTVDLFMDRNPCIVENVLGAIRLVCYTPATIEQMAEQYRGEGMTRREIRNEFNGWQKARCPLHAFFTADEIDTLRAFGP